MDRCWLAGSSVDALQAVLCAAGFNISWLLRAIDAKGLEALLLLFSQLALYAACIVRMLRTLRLHLGQPNGASCGNPSASRRVQRHSEDGFRRTDYFLTRESSFKSSERVLVDSELCPVAPAPGPEVKG